MGRRYIGGIYISEIYIGGICGEDTQGEYMRAINNYLLYNNKQD